MDRATNEPLLNNEARSLSINSGSQTTRSYPITQAGSVEVSRTSPSYPSTEPPSGEVSRKSASHSIPQTASCEAKGLPAHEDEDQTGSIGADIVPPPAELKNPVGRSVTFGFGFGSTHTSRQSLREDQKMFNQKGTLPTDLKKELKEYEALDYTLVESDVQRAKLFDRSRDELESESARVNRLRWSLTFVIAIFTALTAVLLTWCTQKILHYKLSLAQHWIDKQKRGDIIPGAAFMITAGLCTGMLAFGGLFVLIEPVAAGSGIPEIKSLLNGVMVKRSMRIKTLFAKAGGIVMAVGSGLPVGKEGPMIHTGAIMGAGLSQGKSSTFGFDTRWSKFMEFRNDKEKRDFIACGAAAGVAAAFGAPLAGVMFCLEEGTSWWHPDLTWRTLFSAMTSGFVTNVFLSGIKGESNSWGMLSRSGLLAFGGEDGSNPWKYTAWEIPGFVLIGCLGGLIGAGFNHVNKLITIRRQRHCHRPWQRYLEVILVGLLMASLSIGIPALSDQRFCRSVENGDGCPSRDSVKEYTVRLYCDEGEYSVLGSVWFNSPENAIRFLFYEPSSDDIASKCNIPAPALVLFFVPYLLMACVTYGTAVPSGMFVPLILSGAALGRLCGYLLGMFQYSLGIQVAGHGAYALVGSAAMLGGVTRMTISLTLIIIETTGVVQFGLPIFLTALAARMIGHLFNEGLYDIHMELRHVPFLIWDPPTWFQQLRACEVMSFDPTCMDVRLKAGEALTILQMCSHNGFPVVQTKGGVRRLRGFILRKHACALLSKRLRQRVLVSPHTGKSRGAEIQWDDLQRPYPHYPDADKIVLTEEESRCILDLKPYCNPVPHVVPSNATVWHVYQLFRQLGLRHLCVVDSKGDCVGVITRQDLTIEHCSQCLDIGSTRPSLRTWRPLPEHQRQRHYSDARASLMNHEETKWTLPRWLSSQ
mmetsp:Transcript_30692/g.74785  ORF Transcript_30692/g.74785 Transcript_30692/m.74785 type:complete len:927 (-) Transcript_30692:282-3062(-)